MYKVWVTFYPKCDARQGVWNEIHIDLGKYVIYFSKGKVSYGKSAETAFIEYNNIIDALYRVNITFTFLIQIEMLYSISMVSCQKGPTRHAYAWQIGLFFAGYLRYVLIL